MRMTDHFDVLDEYARPSLDASPHWDEMVDIDHGVRRPWRELGAELRRLGRAGLDDRQRAVGRLLEDDGVSYRAHGSRAAHSWELDPIPVLLDDVQWRELDPALAQRSRLLELVLADLYGARKLLEIIPPELVFAHPGFVRAVDQTPGARRLFLTAADLARAPDGGWNVISDRTQAPSGAGYAMENRRVVSRTLPSLYRDSRIQRIGPFFQAMRVALQQLSPTPNEVPRVVLLTPGPESETAFDQAFLSSLLGFPLVEGSDLLVQDGRVWQRSIGRLEPVDVILRRVDAWFCDPLDLRPDSQLGVPGLVEAARLGTVVVVNGLGTGVLENPGLFPLLPRLCEMLLGEPLKLPSAQTWWCGDPASLSHVLANLSKLVIKPISRRITRTSRFGWQLSSAKLDELARRIEADPHLWVGQEALTPSTAPTVGRHGLEARPVLLRTFAVAHADSYRVLAGGLTRVSPDPDVHIVTNLSGAIAKDVWVLAGATNPAEPGWLPDDALPGPVVAAISPRVAEDLFWLGRYAERAESVARLMSITDNRWRDVHPAAEPAIAHSVEVLFGAVIGQGRTELDVAHLTALVVDDSVAGTLAYDLRRIRELANAVRDQLSNDTWAVLGGLDRGFVPFASGESLDLRAMLSRLLNALLAFAGLAAESMVRDAGWHFLDAGRRIERSLQLSRLLRACLVDVRDPAVDDLVVESILIAAESIITHRRRYAARAGIDAVLELLLFDRDNPRSVIYQLDRLEADLERVPTGEGDPLPDDARGMAELLSESAAESLARTEDSRRDDLDELLRGLIERLHGLADSIEAVHFPQSGTLHPLDPADTFADLEFA